MRSNLTKTKHITLSFILLILFSSVHIMFSAESITLVGTKNAATIHKEKPRLQKKMEKKIEKLKKKMALMDEKEEKGKKGGPLLVIGLLTLILGIVLIATAGRSRDSSGVARAAANVAEGCLQLILGGIITMGGIVLLIVGLAV